MNIKKIFVIATIRINRRKLINRHPRGEYFVVPRKGKKGVCVLLYRPRHGEGVLPAVFNVHGGAWIGGDASMLDTQSQELADCLSAFVININYKKLDQKPFPYPQYEIKDTVLYFQDHAKEYGVDIHRFSLIGYSAGGHLCAGAAQLLRDDNFKLFSQILCYPFLEFNIKNTNEEMEKALKMFNDFFLKNIDKSQPLYSPAGAPVDTLRGLPSTLLIACKKDELYSHSVNFEKRLKEADVSVIFKEYPEALHGFLEVNYPDFKEKNDAKSPEQEKLAKECEQFIAQFLKNLTQERG